MSALDEALDVLAHIVSQANVNPVTSEDKHGEYISRYDMPVGSIHKAIPFLARFGVVVDQFGAVHKSDRRRQSEADSAAVVAVLRMHPKKTSPEGFDYCGSCERLAVAPWPCATVRTIEASRGASND
jgi:hypothetical protein